MVGTMKGQGQMSAQDQTERPTLTEFLMARIAEDETEARGDVESLGGWATDSADLDAGALLWRARRTLAECESKRRILEMWTSPVREERRPTDVPGRYDVVTIREPIYEIDGDLLLPLLAMPYADHPDYRDEWRP